MNNQNERIEVTMNNTESMIIGLDLGYGDSKGFCSNGRSIYFPSLVAPAEFVRFQADLGPQVKINGVTLRDTEEGDLFVGELALRQGRPGAVRSPRDRDRVADPIMTHLADAAFAMLLPDVSYARVKLVTGLPVDYYRDAESLAAHLRGTHHVKLDDRRLVVDVAEVHVVPQPFGALLSLLLDEQGVLLPDTLYLAQGRVSVLDCGMYTTDLILVDGLEYVEAGSGSVEVGVSTVLEMLRKVLLDDYRVSYSGPELEVALRRGWLVINGHTVKLNGLASDRLAAIAQSIDARARTLWNISTLSAIVLAGGGSLALRRWLEPTFRQAIFAPDAAMANATGFLRYGLRL
jgi:plasmid segregation protein ParM